MEAKLYDASREEQRDREKKPLARNGAQASGELRRRAWLRSCESLLVFALVI